MSITQAQDWLNKQPDTDQPLYAVLVQIEHNGETECRVVRNGQHTSPKIKKAKWTFYTVAQRIAYDIMTKDWPLKIENGKVDSVFIVEKDTDCRVIEKLKFKPAQSVIY